MYRTMPKAGQSVGKGGRFGCQSAKEQGGLPSGPRLCGDQVQGLAVQVAVTGTHFPVMGLIYTQATPVSPVVSAVMQAVKAQQGERVDREVSRDLDRHRSASRFGFAVAWVSPEPTGPIGEELAGRVGSGGERFAEGIGDWSVFLDQLSPVLAGERRSERMHAQGFTEPAVAPTREVGILARHQRGHQGHVAH